MAKKKADKEVTITETIKISETTALMKLSDGTFKVGFILTQEEVEKLLSEVGEEEKPKGKGKAKAQAKGKGKAKDEDDDDDDDEEIHDATNNHHHNHRSSPDNSNSDDKILTL